MGWVLRRRTRVRKRDALRALPRGHCYLTVDESEVVAFDPSVEDSRSGASDATPVQRCRPYRSPLVT
jgi:hypothetical protein